MIGSAPKCLDAIHRATVANDRANGTIWVSQLNTNRRSYSPTDATRRKTMVIMAITIRPKFIKKSCPRQPFINDDSVLRQYFGDFVAHPTLF